MFITSPMDMNDPFEMRPQWTQEHQDHQTDFRNRLNKMSAGMPLMICTTEGLKPGGVMPDLGEEPKLEVEKMWGFADDYNRAVMKFLHQRFRILSLVRHVIDVEKDYYNSHAEDLLMWAHYADMFQGVAILLDPYKMNCGIRPWKERPGWPIRYKRERMALPVWFYDCLERHPVPVTPEMNHYVSGCIMTLLRTKAEGWRYERETRLIYDKEDILPAGDFDVIWDACPELYRSVFHGQEYRLQYMRSTPDEIETFQRSHTERVAMSKGNVKPTADGFSMPKFAGRKGVNLNRKPMSQAPASEPQADAPPRKRATVKVSDVIIDMPNGDAGHFTEPSREQIDKAIAEGRFNDRINDGASQKAMYDDVRREAGTDLRRAIELITEYHAQRIALFHKERLGRGKRPNHPASRWKAPRWWTPISGRSPLRGCLKSRKGSRCVDFWPGQGGCEGASPQRAVTEQPTQARPKSRATLRAARKKAVCRPRSSVTARCGDAPSSRVRHPAFLLAARPFSTF